MLSGDLFERDFRAVAQTFAVALLQLLNVLLESRRLFQRVAQVKTDNTERQRKEERQAPAPFHKFRFADNCRDQHHNARAEHEAGDRAEVEPAAHKAALAVGRIFGDEDRGAGILAAHREALRHLGEQQQNRRPDANRGVGGDQADTEGTDRHNHNGDGENLLATVLIAQHTEEEAAQWANKERN